MLTSQRNSRRGFTAVELVLVVVVLAILVGVTMWQVDKRRQARLRVESAANLRLLGNALWEAWDTESSSLVRGWAPLSTSPGQLTPEPTGLHIQALLKSENRGAFISPAHPDVERMRKQAAAIPESAITDDSYWYIGYALPDEETGLTFVDAYKRVVKVTGSPPTVDVLNVKLLDSDTELAIERLPAPVWGASSIPSNIPVFIERPGLQRGGSNVLFLDGTVEFIPYPGKWPMTETFIKALESLDELKETHAEKSKQ